MIGTRVAFRGAFGPHEGVVLEEIERGLASGLLPTVRPTRKSRCAPSAQGKQALPVASLPFPPVQHCLVSLRVPKRKRQRAGRACKIPSHLTRKPASESPPFVSSLSFGPRPMGLDQSALPHSGHRGFREAF